MAAAEWESLALGLGTVLLLIGTSIFSYVTIARPMRALSVSMEELAGGNFSVVLPGLGRKDELGAVAGAVEKFKVVSEQKARDEAEAKIRQDQIAAEHRKAEMVKLAELVRSRRRRDRRDRVVGLDRARGVGRHADGDR